jgi:LmbE family N-acetylglucosaminyl deacetylase
MFLGWPDGELESSLRQRWEVAYWIRKCRPDVVLGHDPWRRYRLHPDHRNAGFLATDGIVAARDPHFFPEQNLPHHRHSALLLWEAEEPDHVEDVNGFEGSKLAALLAHQSQFRSTMHIDDASAADQVEAFRQRVIGRLAEHGRVAGMPAGEAFRILREL